MRIFHGVIIAYIAIVFNACGYKKSPVYHESVSQNIVKDNK